MSRPPIRVADIEVMIRLRQEANAHIPGTRERYHNEVFWRAVALQDETSLDLLMSTLDQLVQEVAQARDAVQREQAERRGLIRAR